MIDDELIKDVLRKMGVDPSKPATWKPQYYKTMITGYICTHCGKHSDSKKPICDGCNSKMDLNT